MNADKVKDETKMYIANTNTDTHISLHRFREKERGKGGGETSILSLDG